MHGGWEDLRAWDLMLPLLSSGFEVVAYDRRGHGSSPSSGPGGVDQDVADLVRLLEETDLYPAHLAAQDSSCALALRVAADRPELVRSVLVHEPIFVGEGAPVASRPSLGEHPRPVLESCRESIGRGEIARAAEEYLTAFGASFERWAAFDPLSRSRWLSNGPRWAVETGSVADLRVAAEALGEVAAPVFLTAGARSPVESVGACRAVLEQLSHAQLTLMPDAGHVPNLFAPTILAETWGRLLLDRNVPPA